MSMDPRELAMWHWQSLNNALPHLPIGVYLVGSVSLGDYQPNRSDVDTVTVLRRPLNEDEQQALNGIHATVSSTEPGVRYDTTYLPLGWLRDPPPWYAVTPFSIEGQLRLGQPCGQVHPISWLELRTGWTVAGVEVDDLTSTSTRMR